MNINIKIQNFNGINVVSSRDVAEGLGKRHDNILRDLEKISTTSNVRALILPSNYVDKKGYAKNFATLIFLLHLFL